LLDADGTEAKTTYSDVSGTGYKTDAAALVTDRITGQIYLKALDDGGTVYLSYRINEWNDKGVVKSPYTHSNSDDYATNASLSKTAVAKVSVTTKPFVGTVSISGSITGEVGAAAINLDTSQDISAAVKDESGKEVNRPVVWEAMELPSKGIEITGNQLTFSKSGLFHIRAVCGTLYSPWVEVKAMAPSDFKSEETPIDPEPNVKSLKASQKTVYMPKGSRASLPKVAVYTKQPVKTDITWESSDPKTVSINGSTMFALKSGSAILTATAPDGKTLKMLVNVAGKRTKVQNVAIAKAPKKPIKVGKSVVLKAKIAPYNATGSSGAIITWKSSKPKIVKVDAAGKITALKKGKAKITATVGGKKQTVTITVKK